MKKPLLITLGIVTCLFIGAAVILIAPHLKGPHFKIVNQSSYVVVVSAFWREKEKHIGAIQPSSNYSFSVSDEAAMKFSVHYPTGRKVESAEIYFTGGTVVIAIISDSGIEVKYDFET